MAGTLNPRAVCRTGRTIGYEQITQELFLRLLTTDSVSVYLRQAYSARTLFDLDSKRMS